MNRDSSTPMNFPLSLSQARQLKAPTRRDAFGGHRRHTSENIFPMKECLYKGEHPKGGGHSVLRFTFRSAPNSGCSGERPRREELLCCEKEAND